MLVATITQRKPDTPNVIPWVKPVAPTYSSTNEAGSFMAVAMKRDHLIKTLLSEIDYKIGRHAMISGGSLVRKDVPPYTKAAREPLSYEGVNSVGLRRRDFSTEKITEIQDIYRTLFVKGYNTAKAIKLIETEFSPTTERDEILQFIKESDRGIMKGYIAK